MKDLNKIISGLNQSGVFSGLAGGLAGGALLGALSNKSVRKVGKGALQVGAVAAVTGIAWKAYKSYTDSRSNQAPEGSLNDHNHFSQNSRRLQPENQASQIEHQPQELNSQLLLLRSMITAAYADGHIDAKEKERIYGQVKSLNLSQEEKALLFDEFNQPVSIENLVRQVHSEAMAVEIYTASALVLDTSDLISQGYLRKLASLLDLPLTLSREILKEVSAIKGSDKSAGFESVA